jgi:hypothetical protein
MLVAKINPPAKKIFQKSPFEQHEVLANYMIAKCTQLVIGGQQGSPNEEVTFNVKFGEIKIEKNPDGTDKPPLFDVIMHARVVFTQAELSDWGTDDTIVYAKIANKLGFNILSTEYINSTYTF